MPPKSKGKKKLSPKIRKLSLQDPAKQASSSLESQTAAGVRLPNSVRYGEEDYVEHSVSSFDEDIQSNSISEENSEGENSEGNDQHDRPGIISQRTPTSAERPQQAQRSQSYGPATLAPPFYNRPPTPLPPSPSLTSLLRPRPFNTPLSRTTTPESSDTEATSNIASSAATLNSTEAAVAQSAQAATTVPRASPKVPTYEYYGFVLYIGSSAAFLVYLLWSYLPAAFLHKLGIYYYPNRWWSLAIPAWLTVLVIYIYVALAAWNIGRMTLPLDSLECLVDEKSQVAVIDSEGKLIRNYGRRREGDRSDMPDYGRAGIGARSQPGYKSREQTLPDLDWRLVWDEGTDGVMDIPIGGVCEILYGSSRDVDG